MPNGTPCDHMAAKVFSGYGGKNRREWICKACGAEGHGKGIFRMDKDYPVWRDFWRIERASKK